MTIDIPFIHCLVDLSLLTDGDSTELEECYIFAVTCIAGRPPLFTVHTQSGAVFSRLPIHAFFSLNGPRHAHTLQELCPWTCIGNKAQAITHAYLKNYDGQLKDLGTGRYLFTIDYFDGDYSEDPEQHKTHNIFELESGAFAAVPNNHVLFKDKHFTVDSADPPAYARQRTYWRVD